MSEKEEKLIVDEYSGGEVREYANTPVPLWLKIVYVVVTAISIFWLVYFWNGSRGFFDRGHWHELQTAAKTTRE